VPGGVGHAERVEQLAPHHHIEWRAGDALDQQAEHIRRDRGVEHRPRLEREWDRAEALQHLRTRHRPLAHLDVVLLVGGADGD
jgi:hypothetical protein